MCGEENRKKKGKGGVKRRIVEARSSEVIRWEAEFDWD